MTNRKLLERRRRVKRPLLLVLSSFLLLAMALSNYAGLSLKYNVPFYLPLDIYNVANWKELLLLFVIFISGPGLLLVRLWGWAVFVFSSIVWIIYNVFHFLMYPSSLLHGQGAVVQTILAVFILVYFLRKDIYSPYFNPHRMGWRHFRRFPLELDAHVGDFVGVTRDVSRGGAFVDWPDCSLEPGSAVQIRINVGGFWFSSEGGVASIRPGEGAGIAFRNMDEFTAKELEIRLKELYQAVQNASRNA